MFELSANVDMAMNEKIEREVKIQIKSGLNFGWKTNLESKRKLKKSKAHFECFIKFNSFF